MRYACTHARTGRNCLNCARDRMSNTPVVAIMLLAAMRARLSERNSFVESATANWELTNGRRLLDSRSQQGGGLFGCVAVASTCARQLC